MASTKYYYFSGPCKWAMVHRMDEKFETFKIDVYLDSESLELYEDSGCRMALQQDDYGTRVTFRRRNQQLMGKDLKTFGKPTVIDKESVPITDNVGNGSDVIIKVAVFDTRNGVGHRLESVMVTNLVPYEGSGEPIEEHQTSSMNDIPSF